MIFQKKTLPAPEYPWLKPKNSIPNQLAREVGTLFLLVEPGLEKPGDLIINPLDGRFYQAADKSVKLPRLRELTEKSAHGVVLKLTDQVSTKTVYMHNQCYNFERAREPLTEYSIPHFEVIQGELAGVSANGQTLPQIT